MDRGVALQVIFVVMMTCVVLIGVINGADALARRRRRRRVQPASLSALISTGVMLRPTYGQHRRLMRRVLHAPQSSMAWRMRRGMVQLSGVGAMPVQGQWRWQSDDSLAILPVSDPESRRIQWWIGVSSHECDASEQYIARWNTVFWHGRQRRRSAMRSRRYRRRLRMDNATTMLATMLADPIPDSTRTSKDVHSVHLCG
jgi:hypothetical protein